MPTREAQRHAQSLGLDLVEVSPNADPPVCKIMDYGKFRYDEGIKRKAARKNQKNTTVKEIKFHAGVERNDLETKLRKIRKFLGEGHKVKVTLQYRGRENAHKEIGLEVVKGVIAELGEEVVVEQHPRIMGRILGCLLSPKPIKINTGGGKKGGGQKQQKPAAAPPAKVEEKPAVTPPAKVEGKPAAAPTAKVEEKPAAAAPVKVEEKPAVTPPAKVEEKPAAAPPAKVEEKPAAAPPVKVEEKPAVAPPAKVEEKPAVAPLAKVEEKPVAAAPVKVEEKPE